MSIRTMIVDDEPLAIERLQGRLAEAMAQRRRDWGAYEVALHTLMTRPCEAVPEIPVTCQWPTALSAAKGEPFAWASFMDIVHPGAAPGSDPPAAAAG